MELARCTLSEQRVRKCVACTSAPCSPRLQGRLVTCQRCALRRVPLARQPPERSGGRRASRDRLPGGCAASPPATMRFQLVVGPLEFGRAHGRLAGLGRESNLREM